MSSRKPAEIAYHYIKEQVVNKMLYPGTRIIEEDIVRETGVSRTSVRSALTRLAYEGVVVQHPNRGAEVARPTATDLKQVYEARVCLELDAFRLALKRRSEESVTHMEENLKRQEEMINPLDMTHYENLNREFHMIFIMETQNPYLEKYLNELYNKVATYQLFWDNSVTNESSLETHRRIYEAFRDRDEEKGIQALMEDITLAEESIKEFQRIQ